MNRAEIRNPTLRRTISLAIDREAILKSLSVTLDKENGLINCPLPRNALGYNNNLIPTFMHTKLAKLFVFSLSKSFKSIPPLRLFHSGNEASREACRQIVKSLNEVGLKVTLIEPEEGGGQDPFDADLRYQTFTVNDSAYDLVTLLTRDNPSLSRNAEPFVRDRICHSSTHRPLLMPPTRFLPSAKCCMNTCRLSHFGSCMTISLSATGFRAAKKVLRKRSMREWQMDSFAIVPGTVLESVRAC